VAERPELSIEAIMINVAVVPHRWQRRVMHRWQRRVIL